MSDTREEVVSLFQKLEIDLAPSLDAMAQVAHALGKLLQESQPGRATVRINAVEYVDVAKAVDHLVVFLLGACSQRRLAWAPERVNANAVQRLIFLIHEEQNKRAAEITGVHPTLVFPSKKEGSEK